MQASRVVIEPATMAAAQKPLNKYKRRQLRREMILNYIRKQPTGVPINTHTMALKSGAFTESNAVSISQFVRDMERDGIIDVTGPPKANSKIFVITEDVKVHPIVEQALAGTDTESAPTPPKVEKSTLVEYAKEFAWSTGSDSLREFVAYMDGKELELRRLAD